jgi:hypothetical protein
MDDGKGFHLAVGWFYPMGDCRREARDAAVVVAGREWKSSGAGKVQLPCVPGGE